MQDPDLAADLGPGAGWTCRLQALIVKLHFKQWWLPCFGASFSGELKDEATSVHLLLTAISI
jgi:hypothetical protein